jgi:hypothetical protein
LDFSGFENSKKSFSKGTLSKLKKLYFAKIGKEKQINKNTINSLKKIIKKKKNKKTKKLI